VTLGRLITRSPEPPSPPRASAQSGDDCTQNGCLAGGDPLGGDGIGKGGVQLVDAVTFPSRRCRKSAMVARSSSTALSRARTVRGRTTLVFLPAFPVLTGFVQGDKHQDNTIIADLPRPVLAADQALRGRLRCPADSGELGIGHAAGAVADRKADVVRCRNPPSPNATWTRVAKRPAAGGAPPGQGSLAWPRAVGESL